MDMSNTVASYPQESSEDIVATTEIFRAIRDHYTNQGGDQGEQDVQSSEAASGELVGDEQSLSRTSKEQDKSSDVTVPPSPTRVQSTGGSDTKPIPSNTSLLNSSFSMQTRTEQRTNPYASKLQKSYNQCHHDTSSSTSTSNSQSDRQSQFKRSSVETSVPPPPSLRPAPRLGESPGATAVYPNNPLRQYGTTEGLDMSSTTVANNNNNNNNNSSSSLDAAPPIIQARLVRDSEIMYGNHHYHHHCNTDNDFNTESAQATHAPSMSGDSLVHNSNIAKAVKVVNEDEIGGRRKSFLALLRDWRLIAVFVVLVFAIVGLVVGLTVVKDDSDEELEYSPNSTIFLDPETIAENEDIANNILAEIEAAHGGEVFSPGTPQRLALNWLVNENVLKGMKDFRILQRLVLASLFFSSGGFSSWVNHNGWLSGDHECTWYQTDYFVDGSDQPIEHCDSEGLFQALVLDANGLGGTLPGGLGLFSSLQYLVLPSNMLSSPLPSKLSKLSNLVTIDLSSNDFAGSLPELAVGLRSVLLDNNRFSHDIPSSYENLSSLQYLSLSSNLYLNGTVPSGLAPTDLLDIQNTNISGEISSLICKITAQVLINCSNVVCSCCECG